MLYSFQTLCEYQSRVPAQSFFWPRFIEDDIIDSDEPNATTEANVDESFACLRDIKSAVAHLLIVPTVGDCFLPHSSITAEAQSLVRTRGATRGRGALAGYDTVTRRVVFTRSPPSTLISKTATRYTTLRVLI